MRNTHRERQERASVVDWAANDNYTHAITLNTDRELSAQRMKGICSTFCHLFDKQVHGIRNMSRFPNHLRMRGIFFPENLSTNAHLHGAVDFSAAMQVLGIEGRLQQEVLRAWHKATRGAGSIDVQPLENARWASYCTKDFDGTYFLAADFHPL